MTITEFLRRLRKTPRKWRVESCNGIRSGYGSKRHCPISALAGYGYSNPYETGQGLGLSLEHARAIAKAADGDSVTTFDRRLRRRLLLACGVKERRPR